MRTDAGEHQQPKQAKALERRTCKFHVALPMMKPAPGLARGAVVIQMIPINYLSMYYIVEGFHLKA
jgi:hypothetical protein